MFKAEFKNLVLADHSRVLKEEAYHEWIITGQELKDSRELLELSLAEVAAQLEIDIRTLRHIEKGEKVTFRKALVLAYERVLLLEATNRLEN